MNLFKNVFLFFPVGFKGNLFKNVFFCLPLLVLKEMCLRVLMSICHFPRLVLAEFV